MSLVLQANLAFCAAFPDFDVATQVRPDGGVLLILGSGDRMIARRAMAQGQFNTPAQLEWQISAIRRDLALEAGLSPRIAALQGQAHPACEVA